MTTKPEHMTVCQDMEVNALSYNKYLREKVGGMTNIKLLRNCHPTDRSKLAWKLFRVEQITREELAEFSTKPD
ncbi:MAG TPA: hypothetical protein ENH82_12175 [bacterium]|nr:hypothetical protein [bacterium]